MLQWGLVFGWVLGVGCALSLGVAAFDLHVAAAEEGTGDGERGRKTCKVHVRDPVDHERPNRDPQDPTTQQRTCRPHSLVNDVLNVERAGLAGNNSLAGEGTDGGAEHFG